MLYNDITEEVGHYQFTKNRNKSMKSPLFKLSWTEIKSALVYALLTALAAMLAYIVGLGDIFSISIKPLVNIGAMSLAVGILSVIKNLLTTSEGDFLGAVKVKEPEN